MTPDVIRRNRQVNCYSTREIAVTLGVETWKVQRLFEDGDLPEPTRFAGKRLIRGESLPEIVDALRARGWLRQQEEPANV
jgi:hypothetical protein